MGNKKVNLTLRDDTVEDLEYVERTTCSRNKANAVGASIRFKKDMIKSVLNGGEIHIVYPNYVTVVTLNL